MKKLLSLLLVLAMVVSLGTPGFAAENELETDATITQSVPASEGESAGEESGQLPATAESTPEETTEAEEDTAADSDDGEDESTADPDSNAIAPLASVDADNVKIGYCTIQVTDGSNSVEPTNGVYVIKAGYKVRITLNGKKLHKATNNYKLYYAQGESVRVSRKANTAGTSATFTFDGEEFSKCTEEFTIYCAESGSSVKKTIATVIYDDEKTKISNVTMTVTDKDGSAVPPEAGLYTVQPDDKVILTVTGKHLDTAGDSCCVSYASGKTLSLTSGSWTIAQDGTTATATLEGSAFAGCEEFSLSYTLDGDTYTAAGPTVTYDSGPAQISGISVKVGDTTYTTGTVILTPTSGDVTLIVTGTNLNAVTTNNMVGFPSGYAWTMTGTSWTVTDTEAKTNLNLDGLTSCTTATEIKYTNDGQSTWTGTGIYIVYQADPIFVDILWGSLSFTYSDKQVDGEDEGWTCETDANTVMVKNMDDVTIKVDVAFTRNSEATNITKVTGSFDKDSATLISSSSSSASGSAGTSGTVSSTATFTLTLSGKPDGALSNATIGSVTVTISKAD